LIAASVLLSMATYQWVENPLRHWGLPSRRWILIGAGIVAATVLSLSMLIAAGIGLRAFLV
jgi:peptidoglycan/LPS O-acetylase OafA/YrhL